MTVLRLGNSWFCGSWFELRGLYFSAWGLGDDCAKVVSFFGESLLIL